ncbi:MAG: 1,4-alpha-glucan branching protein GlgB [Clostridiales bacterium]|jgi:1,4-alpha-glucan branching enzyme|nr:1,4-alpha-glucan branching protein GlgB [Clostridiales bacterium]
MPAALIDDKALYYFNTGVCVNAYELLGAHKLHGYWRFAVWAPTAQAVCLAGSFNDFQPNQMPMQRIGDTGVWQIATDAAQRGDLYKYYITARDGQGYWRADPYATRAEYPPGRASVVWDIPKYTFGDELYYNRKKHRNPYLEPLNIYEVHLGSFTDVANYRVLAKKIVDYAADMGYTHLELMPLGEYPFARSWGYQVTGYYAATARYGDPEDLMYFVNLAHQRELGVFLDWVPAHFPKDEHGLRLFDGSPLYEPADTLRAEQPQWGTLMFDYGRTQVQSYLLSNAFYWLKEFHFDGLRVDAVSCMLFLNYGRKEGQWRPNSFGGNENLDAIAFIKKLTSRVREEWPDYDRLLIAEESTAYPYVTKPPEEGGLGFHFKWNMGWMNDTLRYMEEDSYFRKWRHDKLSFSLTYAFSEHYILPFSHDEVVHGKRSLLEKMPGDYWQKFAQLRVLFAYQYAHPGKKLNFMGNEFGQFIEWKYDQSLDWFLLKYPKHNEMHHFTRALNHFYKSTPALYQRDMDWGGFNWVSVNDDIHSIIAFIRWDRVGNGVLCAFNFTPHPWGDYLVNMPVNCLLSEALSSDEACYGGTGNWLNPKPIVIRHEGVIKLPPFGATFLVLSDITPILELVADA